jgi:hypothetical protein
VIVRAVASIGTEGDDLMRDEIEVLPPRQAELAGEWMAQVERRLLRAARRVDDVIAPFPVGRRIARELAQDLDRRGLVRSGFEVPSLACCHGVALEEEDHGGLRLRLKGRLGAFEKMLEKRGLRGGPRPAGRMRITNPPLSVRQPSVLRAGVSARHCGTEGTMIRRPDRLAIDRAIFARTARGGGGTVLVDLSGSMSLSVEQVEEIVRAAGGAAVVALYSGSGDAGELRIVARADRRASSEHFEPETSGNVVDLPALEWLAKQPEPRIWVSDGCVTGVGDQGCRQLLARCLEVAKRGRIERVDDADAAIARLG